MASLLDNWMDSNMLQMSSASLSPQTAEPNWDDIFQSDPMSLSTSMDTNQFNNNNNNNDNNDNDINDFGHNMNDINDSSFAMVEGYDSLNTAPTSTEASLQNSPHIKAEFQESMAVPKMVETLSDKLESMQKLQRLTPKSLESIFDTKDILKDDCISSVQPRRGKSLSALSTISEEFQINRSITSSQSSASTSPQSQVYSHAQENEISSLGVSTEDDCKNYLVKSESTENGPLHFQSVNKINSMNRKRPRKRLTETQKQAHNKIEKKYRININAKIAGLQSIIPWLAADSTAFETGANCDEINNSQSNRLNKSMILEKAIEYIKFLQEQQRTNAQEIQSLKNIIAGMDNK